MIRIIRFVLAFTYLFNLLGPISTSAQTTFDCGAVDEIPQAECEALVALYNSTDGDNWYFNTNWLETNTPSTWYGIYLTDGTVRTISLSYKGLKGSIPAELGNLINLQTLLLDENQLNGSIPAELGNLSSLKELDLSENQLTGSIPAELGNLSSLIDLVLTYNQLTGSIPVELGNLSSLRELYLNFNQLTGSIPAELGNLSSLQDLYLNSNQLAGSIPAEMGNLSNLQRLSLSFNQLTGSIPAELGNLTSLYYGLSLRNNQLTGSIPAELGNLSSLRVLDLVNNQLTGSIPAELGNLSILNQLYLNFNQLTGSIPSALGNLSSLHLQYLYLYNNQLSGSIPSTLGKLSNLESLRLDGNQLTGSIPAELASLTSLYHFSLSNNQLSGPIPLNFPKLDNLDWFDFYETQICEPSDPEFLAWKETVDEWQGTGVVCGENSEPSWLLMYYMAGDNDIEAEISVITSDLRNSPINYDLAIFHDGSSQGTYYEFFSPSGAQLYINKGDLNSGDGTTLSDFITWAKSNSSAPHQSLIIADHGHGLSGVAEDTPMDNDNISLNELEQALSLTGHIDILHIHACLMSTIEWMWQLQGVVDYFVGHESVAYGFYYREYLQKITNETEPRELSILIADAYHNFIQLKNLNSTVSVADLSQLSSVGNSINNLAQEIINSPLSLKSQIWDVINGDELQRIHERAPEGNDKDDMLADLYHFTILTSVYSDINQTLTTDLLQTHEDFIIYDEYNTMDTELFDYSNTWGVSIALPNSLKSFYNGEWLKFAEGADWSTITNIGETNQVNDGEYFWGPMISDLVMTYNPAGADESDPPNLLPLEMIYTLYLPNIIQ